VSTQWIERMAVEIHGSGDAVICIHGLGGTSNTFCPQVAALAGKRIIVPDLLGSGRSPLMEKPSIGGFAQAIFRMADVLGVKSAHVIAHSMGTLVAQHLAAEHGVLVRSLTLLGALPGPSDAFRAGLKARAALARAGGMSDIADTVASAGTSSDTRQRNPAAVAFVRETILRQDPEGYARTCEALADGYPADTARIQCPVLLMTGSDDASTPPSLAQELSAKLTKSRAVILPRCGHWPTVERPDEVNTELKRFIN
jgi:3-oxoadipate enol-lactonase